MFCVNIAIDEGVNETVDANEDNKEIIDVKEFSNEFSETNNSFYNSLQQIIPKPSGDGEGELDKTGKLLEKLFDKTYKNNKVVKEIINAKAHSLWKLPIALTKKDIILSIKDLKIENKQFYMKNRIYVLENEALQLYLLQQYYNSSIHDYQGYKTLY